jgi:hypothetical protein
MGKVDHHKDLSDQEDELAVSAMVVVQRQGLAIASISRRLSPCKAV